QIDNAQADIWVLDLARGVRTRLTVGPVAVWSPNGKWITYVSGRNAHSNIYRKPSDGGGTEELLLTGEPQQFVRNDWSRDGKYLTYSRGTPGATWEIWALPMDGERKPFILVPRSTYGLGSGCSLSPDQRWIAERYFIDPAFSIFTIPVGQVGGALQFGIAQKIVNHWSAPQVFYDVAPNGRRILLDRVSQQVSQSFTILTNFTAELEN
ncbi:MAG: PD40 domain-containing protein, partial [Acidobacteria bacterium]|nr:PD40 domain-containing protein [Acidobacteriota bacterium]